MYRAQISAKGVRPRKYKTCKSIKDLENFLATRKEFVARDATGLIAKKYSVEQMADIKRAMDMLPQGATLTDAVSAFVKYNSSVSISEALATFKSNKAMQRLNDNYFSAVILRLEKFAKSFTDFKNATPKAILEWMLSVTGKNNKPISPKTMGHYRGALELFFKFCVRRDFISNNPMDKISHEDLPAVQSKAPGFLSVEQTVEFFNMLKKRYPQHVKFYAIAMFAGIRIEETSKLKPADVDLARKHIIISADVSKTGKPEILEDFEPGFWAWIKSEKKSPILRPGNKVRNRFDRYLTFKLPHNFARHSFATYHYSLYLDARRTCAITRHSEDMLKRHYLGARVPKKEAEAYFAITPAGTD